MDASFTNLMVLAFIVEVVTNFFKTFVPAIKSKGWTTAVAGIIGGALCYSTATGVLASVGIEMVYPWLDYIITGIVVSRGAGVINDLSKYLAK